MENQLNSKKPSRVYFASDVHLGAPNYAESRAREQVFVRWLDSIKSDATALYIVGDLFDWWYEYRSVVPRGFVRVLGKLAELRDAGIPIYFFVGNHDMWMFGYFEEELDIKVFFEAQELNLDGKRFLVGHGDGLGPDDKGYKLLKKYVFRNRFCQFLLGLLHPTLGIGIMRRFSKESRDSHGHEDEWSGTERDRLMAYAKQKLANRHYDYFIFGHQHVPLKKQINKTSTYINLGDWIKHFSYAVFDGKELELCYFKEL